jgi:hypothetical protein
MRVVGRRNYPEKKLRRRKRMTKKWRKRRKRKRRRTKKPRKKIRPHNRFQLVRLVFETEGWFHLK